jgi:hypothetical protein
VNDNNFSDRYLDIDTTLTNLGYSYGIYNTVTEGTFPDFAYLENFDVVVWYTGNDGTDLKLWDISNPSDYKFNEPLMEYLNNGGIVWLQGLDFMYDVFGLAPDAFSAGQFIYDYMGIASYTAQSFTDDGSLGVSQLDVVPGNSLCTITPLQWSYATMNFVDGFDMTPDAEGIYKMGPTGYVLDYLYSGVYRENNESKIFTLGTETARIDTQQHTDTFFQQVLESFNSMNQQNYTVNLTVFLEGPFDQTQMSTYLNEGNTIPLNQPFNAEPWNYFGSENVTAIPNSNVVDWVLVELRDAQNAVSATQQTRLARKAGFLLKNGHVVDLDGNSLMSFNETISESLFVVVWHRNHLGILSANALTGFNNNFSYNFTDSNLKAYGTNAQKNLGSGKYGMYTGDFNADKVIDLNDKSLNWNSETGKAGYLSTDGNLDTQTDNTDKNLIWMNNINQQCQVPQ